VSTRVELVAKDKRYVWHPYTAMDQYEAEVDPLVVQRALGARLFDVDGRSYLDGNASWWVAALGHGHPRLVRALGEQAARLAHCALAGITHAPAAELAERMIARAPGMARIFYVDDGSTAIEAAVKMAVQMWAQSGRPRRTRLLALEGAFHGDTIGAASLGGVEVFRRPFAGVLFDCLRVDAPFAEADYERAFAALEKAVAASADELAAVVLEPIVQGASGMRLYPPAFLAHARAVCDRHDVLLVADEVFTGYGRTGRFWACDHASVRPDLLCTAKGFSGGMLPMGAVLATSRVEQAFRGDRDRAFYYGHSFCGNPLGAAVALEVLRVFDEERVLDGITERAARIAARFAKLGALDGVTATRSLGMIGALDLRDDGGYLARAGWRVYDEARRRGAYLRPLGNVVYVTPPLNIPLADLDELLDIVEESVRAVLMR